ncbi:MFS transporter [Faecalicatena sp. AGMB00832]|uniref:MFS transporter n=1 Tax=Faecalicatena faecalis TaxID=2726362 RepID=A0ABS6D0K3_9FIRM|nr:MULTISPECIES: MFS transporter [Faecalicatena]MBU3874885.1 MFS transporter [Faecalicatena faecalis]MCI6465750.1 MFS transporter [Faecalicatena sp.]MDY5618836.1 MFS transporter [Lachnospiraceae bacterium]
MSGNITKASAPNRKYLGSAFILYLNFFIHGIGCSLLGQQVIKEFLAGQWGTGVEKVTMVAAALGLGRLITLPFSGPISDRMGRRPCALMGIASYALFFIGIAFSPNMTVAYIAAVLGGAANSFLDTGVIPACVEIMEPKSGLATMLTKLFISVAQLILPFIMGALAAANLPYSVLMYVSAAAILVIGVLVFKIPLPENKKAEGKADSFLGSLKKAKFTMESVALIVIGFTCTATFQLWLNCAQTFGKEVAHMADPSLMQTYYSAGTIAAIFITSILVNKFLPVRFLAIYPAIAAAMLIAVYVVKTPFICQVGAFVIGYSAAGGVLQLATATVNDLFPTIKGTITSIIMIASSLSNYTILSLAGSMQASKGAASVIMLNIVITIIGVVLALFVNLRYGRLTESSRG